MTRTITIDCRGIRTEAEFWQAYVDAVQPEGAEFFGRNLDAFEDALDGGPGFPDDAVIVFAHTAALQAQLPRRFLKALKQIATERPQITVT